MQPEIFLSVAGHKKTPANFGGNFSFKVLNFMP